MALSISLSTDLGLQGLRTSISLICSFFGVGVLISEPGFFWSKISVDLVDDFILQYASSPTFYPEHLCL